MSFSELYPKTFSLLYCPFGEAKDDACDFDEPTDNPFTMLKHLKEAHGVTINEPEACFPFFDRYLRTLPERAQMSTEDFSRLDAGIRIRLQTDRLIEILDLQERERTTLYHRPYSCLFCEFVGEELPVTFQHMFLQHKFNIGQLENLVMVPTFLSILQRKINQGLCIFCEQTHTDREKLLIHMRMRQHFKIHPKNHLFDQFYISNYVTVKGPTAKGEEDGDEEAEDNTWDDLNDLEDTKTSCVFCSLVLDSPEAVYEHLKASHAHDLIALLTTLTLEERFQYVNCLRYHQQHLKCVSCQDEFANESDWEEHYVLNPSHCECVKWREPQYLFPAYNENDDPLRYSLDFDD